MDDVETNSLLTSKSPSINTGPFETSKLSVITVTQSSRATDPTLSNVSTLRALLPTLNLNLVDDPFDSIGHRVSVLLLTRVCNPIVVFTHDKFAFRSIADVTVVVSTL